MLLSLSELLQFLGVTREALWDEIRAIHTATLLPWIMCVECVLTSSWVGEVQGVPGDNNQRLLWPILRVFQREKYKLRFCCLVFDHSLPE